MRFIIISLILTLSHTAQAGSDCGELMGSLSIESYPCLELGCTPQELTKEVRQNITEKQSFRGLKNVSGYAILIATMIGSAALTTYFTGHLPNDLKFLSIALSQLSTLGFVVFGMPILGPMVSNVQKMAFGVRAQGVQKKSDKDLESQWFRTQENYSVNSQMSRNVISVFIASIKQNFYEAQRAMTTKDVQFAATQVAEAAIRLRYLARDISPTNFSVRVAVQTTFMAHISDPDFKTKVLSQISKFDPDAEAREAKGYYQELMECWFGQQS
jgi:hypothetical protein